MPKKLELSVAGIPLVAPDVRRLIRSSGEVLTGGEAQSCVLPPGVHPASPQGRLFVTNDALRPPLLARGKMAPGPVFSQSLDATDGQMLQAQFESPPNSQDYRFGTNDHDLLLGADGSILYITGAFTKRPLNPKPAWFDVTYRNDFGPGARSNVMVWRSRDAGKTFEYIGEMDPAQVGDGSFAYPQWPQSGTPQKPVYDMGGTDGQTAYYDARTKTLFLIFGGVGYLPDTTKQTPFTLSSKKLNKTLVMASTDDGKTWSKQGEFDGFSWRYGIVAQTGKPPIFAQWLSTLLISNTDYSSLTALSSGPGAGWLGFGDNTALNPLKQQGTGLVYANIWAHQIAGRMPGGRGAFQAYPDIIEARGIKLYGYRLFFFDYKTREFAELPPILPRRRRTDQLVMHLTAIDPGDGPVLLYWMDVDGEKKTITIRGRALLDEETCSADTTLSRREGKDDSLALHQRTWYGDYWSAGGFVAGSGRARQPSDRRSFIYYPMWIEPGGQIVCTKVTVEGYLDQTRRVDLSRIPMLVHSPLTRKKPNPPDPHQGVRLRQMLERYERHR